MSRLTLFAIAAGLGLSACANGPGPGALTPPAQAALTVAGAIALETGAQAKCPRSAAALSLFMLGRASFDIWLRPKLGVPENALIDATRRTTDLRCGLAPVPAPAAVALDAAAAPD